MSNKSSLPSWKLKSNKIGQVTYNWNVPGLSRCHTLQIWFPLETPDGRLLKLYSSERAEPNLGCIRVGPREDAYVEARLNMQIEDYRPGASAWNGYTLVITPSYVEENMPCRWINLYPKEQLRRTVAVAKLWATDMVQSPMQAFARKLEG